MKRPDIICAFLCAILALTGIWMITSAFSSARKRMADKQAAIAADLATNNYPMVETTVYRYPNHKYWTTEVREFTLKGHTYIFMTGSPVHAQHCACLSTNK